jgi:hypothetical protein
MMSLRNTLAVLTLTLALPPAAALARAERPVIPDFAAVDANGDGMIVPEELAGARAGRLARADRDGDGYISRDELVQAAVERRPARNAERAAERASRMADRLFARADRNGDGLIGPDEMPKPTGRRLFARIDTDGNGVITPEEAAAPRPARTRPVAAETTAVEDPAASR